MEMNTLLCIMAEALMEGHTAKIPLEAQWTYNGLICGGYKCIAQRPSDTKLGTMVRNGQDVALVFESDPLYPDDDELIGYWVDGRLKLFG
jgi:hypothetical protein